LAGFWIFVYREKDNSGIWIGLQKTLCCLNSVHDWHGDIQYYHIGAQSKGSLQCGLTVIYGTHNFTAIGRQKSTYILKHLLMVVGYQDTDFVHANSGSIKLTNTDREKNTLVRRAVRRGDGGHLRRDVNRGLIRDYTYELSVCSVEAGYR
jgi:hypothetical protein